MALILKQFSFSKIFIISAACSSSSFLGLRISFSNYPFNCHQKLIILMFSSVRKREVPSEVWNLKQPKILPRKNSAVKDFYKPKHERAWPEGRFYFRFPSFWESRKNLVASVLIPVDKLSVFPIQFLALIFGDLFLPLFCSNFQLSFFQRLIALHKNAERFSSLAPKHSIWTSKIPKILKVDWIRVINSQKVIYHLSDPTGISGFGWFVCQDLRVKE